MRFKRVNTLALDVSSLPTNQRYSCVQLVLQPALAYLKLEPAKLKSVQVHSSRRTIYIGLPDNLSAEAIAAKTPRFSIHLDGVKHHVPLVFVDEDVLDVRVRDVPPEVPNDVIKNKLRKYGEVLSVTSEVWRDFFPGVLTGVRIARMKVTQPIEPSIQVANYKAFITYDGQPDTSVQKTRTKQQEQQNEKASPPASSPGTAAADATDIATDTATGYNAAKKLQHITPQYTKPTGNCEVQDDPMQEEGDCPSPPFLPVKRRKGKNVSNQVTNHVQNTPTQQAGASPSEPAWVDVARKTLIAMTEQLKKDNEQQNRTLF